MIFEKSCFIKPDIPFSREFTGRNHAPLFRKRITVHRAGSARLWVCALGYGYVYLNGQPVSPDLFTAPVSDYNKTLWYNTYEVSHLLREGENLLAVWCGNGWYNEEFQTSWDYDQAPWRDLPKFILRLCVDGETAAVSDDSWKCCPDSAIYFNALRSGEYFDARIYQPDWNKLEFDDSGWQQAAVDLTPPAGVFRECPCEPIRECGLYHPRQVWESGGYDSRQVRECGVYDPRQVWESGGYQPLQDLPGREGVWTYDLGRNISGYIRLTIAGRSGQLLTIRYGEQLKEDGSLELNQMTEHYPQSEFQTDRFICSGERLTWSPRFAYHGFRYIQIEGLSSPKEAEVLGVFVHQDIGARSSFTCSDPFLNRLFEAGRMSTYSNLFYMPTDCPTREKLGWANDAAASAEQLLTNFKAERLLEKWLQDIYDAMDEKGALPGIIPTSGWGFTWGNGPVSDGVLFEVPYRLYLHTGDSGPLIASLPYFDRYLAYLKSREDEKGWIHFGLTDWARPGQSKETGEPKVPSCFINALLVKSFYEIAALGAELAEAAWGKEPGASPGSNETSHRSCEVYRREAERLKRQVLQEYLTLEGRCRIHAQTAVAMLIYHGAYEELTPLREQLKELVEEADFHHGCGMVGLRRLYEALNQCGLWEYAYRILTAEGYPGYRDWFDQGAVTLWETWDWADRHDSKNHHMYSDVMSWMIKTILGIRQEEGSAGFSRILVEPHFFAELT